MTTTVAINYTPDEVKKILLADYLKTNPSADPTKVTITVGSDVIATNNIIQYVSPLIPSSNGLTYVIPGIVHKLYGLQSKAIMVQLYTDQGSGIIGDLTAGWTVNTNTGDITISFATIQLNFFVVIYGLA